MVGDMSSLKPEMRKMLLVTVPRRHPGYVYTDVSRLLVGDAFNSPRFCHNCDVCNNTIETFQEKFVSSERCNHLRLCPEIITLYLVKFQHVYYNTVTELKA
jgi:hypothetical protein